MLSAKQNLSWMRQPDTRIQVVRWQPIARILPVALLIDAALGYIGWVIWEIMR
jgi:hypothetical protein